MSQISKNISPILKTPEKSISQISLFAYLKRQKVLKAENQKNFDKQIKHIFGLERKTPVVNVDFGEKHEPALISGGKVFKFTAK